MSKINPRYLQRLKPQGAASPMRRRISLLVPDLPLSRSKAGLDLVVVSVVELGLSEETSSLENIYSRVHELGLALAPADTGPQLGLQYFDQPVGEFLYVGTEPIKAKRGDANIFIVVNGGAGLLLLGQDVRASDQFFPSSQFVFVRGPREHVCGHLLAYHQSGNGKAC